MNTVITNGNYKKTSRLIAGITNVSMSLVPFSLMQLRLHLIGGAHTGFRELGSRYGTLKAVPGVIKCQTPGKLNGCEDDFPHLV